MPGDAYRPPETRADARPSVILWFRIYAAAMALACAAVVVAGLVLREAGEIPVSLGAAPLAVLYATAALAPLEPWAWTLGLVAIAFGLPSCTFVAALPLLLRWLRPEVKAAFARL